MITKKRLLEIITTILEQDDGAEGVVSGTNISGWDSLSQLNILLMLDQELQGRASGVDDLAKCKSSDEIYEVLVMAKLAQPVQADVADIHA